MSMRGLGGTFRREFGKRQLSGQIQPATCCKYSFIGTQPHPFTSVLSVAAFAYVYTRRVSICDSDCKADRAYNIYYLALCREYLLTLLLEGSLNSFVYFLE